MEGQQEHHNIEAPKIHMCGMKAPRYIRSANLTNQTSGQIVVTATFQSASNAQFIIPSGSTIPIQRQIDQGGYTTVDPLESFTVNSEALTIEVGHVCQPANSIQIRSYVFDSNGVLTRTK